MASNKPTHEETGDADYAPHGLMVWSRDSASIKEDAVRIKQIMHWHW